MGRCPSQQKKAVDVADVEVSFLFDLEHAQMGSTSFPAMTVRFLGGIVGQGHLVGHELWKLPPEH